MNSDFLKLFLNHKSKKNQSVIIDLSQIMFERLRCESHTRPINDESLEISLTVPLSKKIVKITGFPTKDEKRRLYRIVSVALYS